MKRKLLIIVSLLMLASVVLAACKPAAKKIRVVTDATWPPFEMVDETSKELIGFDPELIAMIAEKEGLDIELINVPFDSALAGLANCQYDVAISAVSITEERKQNMLFSDPYYAAGQLVTVSIDNTDIAGKDDLSGKKVGAMLGTTGAIEAEAIPGVIYSAYDTIDQAFLDVMNGQIDAVIADNPLALGFVAQYPDKLKTVGDVFTAEYYGIAVCKDKPELLAKINSGLAAVQADGGMDALVQKWIVDYQP